MIRFPFLEQFGVTAVMSDIGDGDCCGRGEAEGFLKANAIDSPERLVLVSQVHGVTLVDSELCEPSDEADGILSNTPGALLGIRVADCVPVLLYDPVNRAGAVVHAGRAGTHQGIAGAAVLAMQARYESDPEELIGVIGPSAGPCCYEVGDDILGDFEENGGISRGKCLDLWETNRKQLSEAGVLGNNIDISNICTICEGEFHSYRSNKTASRNLVVLGLPSSLTS